MMWRVCEAEGYVRCGYEAAGCVPCRPYRFGVGVDGVGGVDSPFVIIIVP